MLLKGLLMESTIILKKNSLSKLIAIVIIVFWFSTIVHSSQYVSIKDNTENIYFLLCRQHYYDETDLSNYYSFYDTFFEMFVFLNHNISNKKLWVEYDCSGKKYFYTDPNDSEVVFMEYPYKKFLANHFKIKNVKKADLPGQIYTIKFSEQYQAKIIKLKILLDRGDTYDGEFADNDIVKIRFDEYSKMEFKKVMELFGEKQVPVSYQDNDKFLWLFPEGGIVFSPAYHKGDKAYYGLFKNRENALVLLNTIIKNFNNNKTIAKIETIPFDIKVFTQAYIRNKVD